MLRTEGAKSSNWQGNEQFGPFSAPHRPRRKGEVSGERLREPCRACDRRASVSRRARLLRSRVTPRAHELGIPLLGFTVHLPERDDLVVMAPASAASASASAVLAMLLASAHRSTGACPARARAARATHRGCCWSRSPCRMCGDEPPAEPWRVVGAPAQQEAGAPRALHQDGIVA